jgi:hypothetical protein
MDKVKDVSRRRFFQILGSVVAGGALVGFAGAMFKRSFSSRGTALPALSSSGGTAAPAAPVSPYRLVGAFETPDLIESFELSGDRLIVAVPGGVVVYDHSGTLLNNFAVGTGIRDMAAAHGALYLLYPSRVEVCDMDGGEIRSWEARDAEADYCSMAVTDEGLFVTDAGSKTIRKYTLGGELVRVIESPDRFIVPSYSFGITCAGGVLYCSNPGRHRVESYSLDGEYLGSFGRAGGAEGMFSGCCNPVHLTTSAAGEIIASEKGVPRISCYSSDGTFRSTLLGGEALGGGNNARRVKTSADRIFVAGPDRVSVFRYDPRIASATACGSCATDCPLRTGTLI